MLHQVGVSFDLYYDARKHKIKRVSLIMLWHVTEIISFLEICVRGRLLYKASSLFSDEIFVGTGVWGIAVAQWLRCCATNWKVAGSIPDSVNGIFH